VGRARLLVEVMRGDPVGGGWRDQGVRDALDLCLSCKGCKSDCPVSVDMAAYKAEFLHHHYRGRTPASRRVRDGARPPGGRGPGSLAPGVANALTRTPGVSASVEGRRGRSRGRTVPEARPADVPLVVRATRRTTPAATADDVVLWPDTFTNHFQPWVAKAAVEVLERAGHRVLLPPRGLCCGRPLYDHGMLTRARREGRRSVEALRPFSPARRRARRLEPSCVAVFRDELPNLFPDDPRTRDVAAGTRTFRRVLMDDHPQAVAESATGRHALVQTHCHQHAVLGFEADLRVMARGGLDVERPEPGCCGMAGGFGFERSAASTKWSCAVAEQALLPALRGRPDDTLVLADGFSCRETDRPAERPAGAASGRSPENGDMTTPLRQTAAWRLWRRITPTSADVDPPRAVRRRPGPRRNA
jgi:Fe-S oxidoreductase